MAVITDGEKGQLRGLLERGLTNEVKIIHFTSYESNVTPSGLVVPGRSQNFYEETRQLLAEVASLSSKLSLEIHDYDADIDGAARYRIDKVPATLLVRGNNDRVRYYGIPSGFQFSTLVEALVDVSRGSYRLMPETKDKLQLFINDVHIQIFTTTH